MATALDNLDQINVTTRRYISKSPQLIDLTFNQDPLNYELRRNLNLEFTGGNSINEDFVYAPLPGGGYQKGKQFNTGQRQTEKQLRFDIKFMQVSVTLYQEDIQVLNKGPLAAINLLKGRINQGYMALGAYVSIASYLPGNVAGYFANINGLAEGLTDATAQSWDGNTYPIYGGLTRASYNNALVTTPTNLNGGSLEYDTLDQKYMGCFYGSGDYEPNRVFTTPVGFSYLKSKYQTQQRFQSTSVGDAKVGFTGLQFNNAVVLAGRYCPGSYLTASSGLNDPVAVAYLTETSDTGGGPSVTAYPTGNLGTGESAFIMNCRQPWLRYYVSDDPIFGGGFRDFIPQGGNTILVGQVLLAHNMTMMPKYHTQIFNFKA